MKISPNGISLLKAHEGLRLFAYLDPVGVWTIGYGHTKDVSPGQHISPSVAEEFLRQDLSWAEDCVNNSVKVSLSQNQFDALVSFVFNVGVGAFQDSTLLRQLNAGNYSEAAEEFLRWDKGTINGEKVVLPGLVTRRKAEQKLFLTEASASVPSPEKPMPIPALVAALLPAVISAIPRLATLFPKSEVAERNVAAATAVLDIVTKAVPNAQNAQAAVEEIQKNPEALALATKAIEDNWFALHKASEESILAARQFAVSYAQNQQVRTVVGKLTFLELLSLFLVISTLAGGVAVLLWGGIDAQLKGAVVTLMLIGGYTAVTQFWFGSSLGSKRKDDENRVV